ncbi:hypothetical protein ABZP36_004419 [Zizania latifolia]
MTRMTSKRRRANVGDSRLDLLSALPDNLLRLILSLLDTRTMISTVVLSRHWVRLPREITSLSIRVNGVLPPRYHRSLAKARGVDTNKIDALVERYEHRAMRAFVDGVTSLVEGNDADDGNARRHAKSLCLEFFLIDDPGCVDRLISVTIVEFRIDDLEVVVKPEQRNLQDGHPTAYTFPHHCLDSHRRRRLRRLTLGNCTPPLHEYEDVRT